MIITFPSNSSPCHRKKLKFNVEIGVFCTFCKREMDDNINFQHSKRGQHPLLPLPWGTHGLRK